MLSGTKLAGSNSKRGRVENDFYATNPKAVEMLLSNNDFLKWFWKDYNNGNDIELLEPCVGQGHIIQGIKSYYNNKIYLLTLFVLILLTVDMIMLLCKILWNMIQISVLIVL